jgi:hypothetical protein
MQICDEICTKRTFTVIRFAPIEDITAYFSVYESLITLDEYDR